MLQVFKCFEPSTLKLEIYDGKVNWRIAILGRTNQYQPKHSRNSNLEETNTHWCRHVARNLHRGGTALEAGNNLFYGQYFLDKS